MAASRLTLEGKRVAVLATDGVEQVELVEPVRALREIGAVVTIVAPEAGEIQAYHHLEKAERIPVDRALADARALDFDALVLPGGVANPDALRTDPRAVEFVRDFLEADKPIAAICHAPWLLIETGLIRGRTVTSWPSLRRDVENAGATWQDREVIVDQKLVTSRNPDDLPAFCDRMVAVMAAASEELSLDRMVEQSFPASDPLPPPTAATGRGTSSEAAPPAPPS